MDEFNKDPFEISEIDKIQQEIDRDLLKAEAIEKSALTIEPEMEGQITLEAVEGLNNTVQGKRETVHTSVIEADYGDNRGKDSVSQNSQFFKETVKNETDKRGQGKYKRFIAVVCIVSILGGSTAGILIPISNKYILPRLSGDTQPVSDQPEANFSWVRGDDGSLPGETSQPHLTGVLSYAELIDAVEPSVVCITSNILRSSEGSFLAPPSEYEDVSGGSGIIFDKDDNKIYIVTNEHVVSGASSVAISIKGSEDVPASLVGKDANSDLAVISVNVKDLQQKGVHDYVIAAFGASDSMRVGDFVIAIGNALGEGNTATFGFVSAKDKEINVEGRELTVIQTDAAINPGNSGGPLINLKGEVIGINMVKYVEASVEGTGYALTSDIAMPIIEQLRNQTAKPMLGVSVYTMTETVADAFNLPMMGVIVDSVVEGSAAAKAGIMQNDIITSFNGQTMFNKELLTEEVQKCKIGDKVEVKLIRNGTDTITLTVTLTELNNDNF